MPAAARPRDGAGLAGLGLLYGSYTGRYAGSEDTPSARVSAWRREWPSRFSGRDTTDKPMPRADATTPLLDASTEVPTGGDQPAPCCTSGAHPAASATNSSLRGSFESLPAGDEGATTECYVVSPPTGTAVKGSVLVVHDIFGLHTGRHTQYCDELAGEGWIVCLPDVFGDGRARADAALLPRWPIKGIRNVLELLCCCKVSWMSKAMKMPWSEIEPRLCAAIKRASQIYADYSVSTQPNASMPLFAHGFCWGAWPVARLLANANATYSVPQRSGAPELSIPSVWGGICFHPSFQVGGDVSILAAAVKRPLLLCPCGDDPADVQDGGLVTQQLQHAGRNDFKVHSFPDMLHGFMMRGPLDDSAISKS